MAATVFAAAFTIPTAVRAGQQGDAESEARAAYNAKAAKGYTNRFTTPDKIFLPSNMTTETGQFIDPKLFSTAQYCAHCHQEAHAQWRQSAHANSNRVPYYLRNVNLLNAEKGINFSRHCEGCHDPIAVAAGAITEGAPRKRPYDQDGVTCMVCHSIKSVDTRGTGSYVLAEPAVLVDETGKPIHRPVSDAEIYAHLDRHSAAVMKPLYRTSEFCSTCHKAALPQTLNGYKWQRAISLYDEWQNSSFAKESPLPFYKKDTVSTCQTCHMQREDLGAAKDFGAKKGQLVSHRWLGANTLIPILYNYPDQGAKVTAFLQNAVFNIDLFALEPESPPAEAAPAQKLIAPLGSAPFTLTPGERVTASVVIQNKGIAHSHVPEQRDMYESWVAFTVKDASGKVIAQSGFIRPDGELDPAAHSFTNRLVNKQGTPNDLHQVWDNRVVAYNNTIQSGRSQLVRYAFTLPKGPVAVTAAVRYRRFDQHFIDFGMSMPAGQHYPQPIVDMVSTTRTFTPGENPAVKAPATQNPEWMRWNNYGIALLDAQQYAASVAAFERVAKLRPDYADAPTNIGLAYLQWEKYDEALPYFEKSLSLARDNARALYYRALVERNQGQVDQAIEDLKKVETAFPRSRDAHRELGFAFYQQHKYPDARAEYEQVQSIDPDDLAAHYNLAILYRRLGLKDKASEQAAYFADQKDDPTASTYALTYLRSHREIAQESVPWHVHDLDHRGKDEVTPLEPITSGSMASLTAPGQFSDGPAQLTAPEFLPGPSPITRR